MLLDAKQQINIVSLSTLRMLWYLEGHGKESHKEVGKGKADLGFDHFYHLFFCKICKNVQKIVLLYWWYNAIWELPISSKFTFQEILIYIDWITITKK